jgi:hypothetical protein
VTAFALMIVSLFAVGVLEMRRKYYWNLSRRIWAVVGGSLLLLCIGSYVLWSRSGFSSWVMLPSVIANVACSVPILLSWLRTVVQNES